MRSQVMIERAADHLGVSAALEIDMSDLAECVNTGIRAPGAVYRDPLAAEMQKGGFECLLDRHPRRLALPADQTGSIVLDRQPVAGHGRIVPVGIAKPRSSAAVSIGE